jgi:hypothetical protein
VVTLSPSVLVSFSYGVLSAREINSTLFHDTFAGTPFISL